MGIKDTIITEAARIMASKRKAHKGGLTPKPTPCPKCGANCESVRAARKCCVGKPRAACPRSSADPSSSS
jgi:hypothetical protein